MSLDHAHARPATRQVPRGHQACRARAHHGNARRALARRCEATRPAMFPLPIGDGALVVVNRLGLVVARQVARRLAQRRAHAAGELGHGACQRQTLRRLLPLSAPHQVVPLGNEVVQRAPRRARRPKRLAHLAKRHATRHAAACLHARFVLGNRLIQLVEIARALLNRSQAMRHAAVLQKCSGLSHGLLPFLHGIECDLQRFLVRLAVRLGVGNHVHHALIVARNHFHEMTLQRVELV